MITRKATPAPSGNRATGGRSPSGLGGQVPLRPGPRHLLAGRTARAAGARCARAEPPVPERGPRRPAVRGGTRRRYPVRSDCGRHKVTSRQYRRSDKGRYVNKQDDALVETSRVLDDPQRPQHPPAGRRAAVPLAGPRPGGRRLGARRAHALRHQRLPRRLPRPPLDQTSKLGEILDPVADRLYILAVVVGLALRDIIPLWLAIVAARPRPVPVVPGAVPAHPRLQRAAGALPRQGGHGQPALRLPAAAARRRRRARSPTLGRGVRLGVRDLGHRDVLVGRAPLRLAGPHAAGRPRPKGADDSMAADDRDAGRPPADQPAARRRRRRWGCSTTSPPTPLDEDYAHVAERGARPDAARTPAGPASGCAGGRSALFGLLRRDRRACRPRATPVRRGRRHASRWSPRSQDRSDQLDRAPRPGRASCATRWTPLRRRADLEATRAGRQRCRRAATGSSVRTGAVAGHRPRRADRGRRRTRTPTPQRQACSTRTCRSSSTGCGRPAPRRSRSTASGSPPDRDPDRRAGDHRQLRSLSPPYTVLAIGDPDTLPARFVESAAGTGWLNLQSIYGLQFDDDHGGVADRARRTAR